VKSQILLSCGEASGDLYASELVRELKALDPEIECFGIGGEKLAGAGAEVLVHLEDISVIGLVEVVEKLPALWRARRRLVEEARRRQPAAAVLIDFSGFNLRLARKLHAQGIPILYYVSPQVWAWRRRRVRTIRETAKKMLVILPFEESFYRSEGIPVAFVGHPLVDLVHSKEDRAVFCKRLELDPGRPLITLLPGSRRREIELHLPVLAAAVERMRSKRSDLQFVALKAPTVQRSEIEEGLVNTVPPSRIIEGSNYEGLTHAAVSLVASGTATVEAALCGSPMVMFYRIGELSYLMGKPFVRVPHYAMVNLIAEKALVPELIQDDMTEEAIAAKALELLEDGEAADTMRRGLSEVKARLGGGGASRRAAEEIMEVVTS
jgi:lipid-A-disaccharide synthase